MLQAAELVRLIGDGDTDSRGAAEAFDAWTREHVKPWYEDQVYWDATLLARFRRPPVGDGPSPPELAEVIQHGHAMPAHLNGVPARSKHADQWTPPG
jgi:hypothetical protein